MFHKVIHWEVVDLINLNVVMQSIEGAGKAGSSVWRSVIKPIADMMSNALSSSSPQTGTDMEEEYFGGVPISELDRMARESFRGEGAEIEDGALIFKSRSKSGKTKGRMRFYIDEEGELERPTFTYYPGQYCSPAEVFWNKLNDKLTKTND